ncbi:hypothetical protein NXS98_11170 [Fontisphaera persica]|uniref:hypothetical protein n=1 Tax=Fontisphaera persica TaxID=2974023 RepID=UPI0024BFE292|nr:hypothetical protein [Fontisphaera persica]WCJ58285.1 hypothetical protein NXS98_11170 [Fontisphaera persica]
MKKSATNSSPAPSAAAKAKSTPSGRIHPVVIYPFQPPNHYHDLEELYGLVARLNGEPQRFARPITVMDRKTAARLRGDKAFEAFRSGTVAKHSDLIEAWCVDTCQMWYTGLGAALDRGRNGDVYWLIPGDFNYGSPVGREVLGRLHDLPEIIEELDQDLCVGEITRDGCDSKCLIDTYGTFALLLNWFPEEAQEIRRICERPRSEFFAISHSFLTEVMHQRWYAYEQTLVILLQAVFSKRRVSRFGVGDLTDLPQGQDTLAAAVQQIERLERVLKMVWRERHERERDWFARYRLLEEQSSQIRTTANALLSRLLK